MNILLSRDEFREAVFKRDNYKCVVCGATAVDAHHIIERRLWPDEGYYITNGASLCAQHHRMAETNHMCPDIIRAYAKITVKVYPPQLDSNKDYDKWGVELRKPNMDNTKYPSTSYLNFSPSMVLEDEQDAIGLDDFIGVPIVITTKMDGSNVKLTNNFIAARNGFDAPHPSFDLLKQMHTTFAHLMPSSQELFGEWLYAKHSISYDSLEAYLQLFGVFDNSEHLFMSWYWVEFLSRVCDLKTVPVLIKDKVYNNKYELKAEIERLGREVIAAGHEGIVIRYAKAFHYGQFSRFVAKYVRPNHVQTDVHWRDQQIVKNKLKVNS